MQKLTSRLKRVLNKDLQAIYQVGWIDGDLLSTSDGKIALLELLFDKHEADLAAKAREKIAEWEENKK